MDAAVVIRRGHRAGSWGVDTPTGAGVAVSRHFWHQPTRAPPLRYWTVRQPVQTPLSPPGKGCWTVTSRKPVAAPDATLTLAVIVVPLTNVVGPAVTPVREND